MKTVAAIFVFALASAMVNAQNDIVVGEKVASSVGDIASICKKDKVCTDTSASRMLQGHGRVFKLFPTYIYKAEEIEGYQVDIYGKYLGAMYKYVYMLNTTENYGSYSADWENDSIVLVSLTKGNGLVARGLLLQLPSSKGGTLVLLKDMTNSDEIETERRKCWPYPLQPKSNPVKPK